MYNNVFYFYWLMVVEILILIYEFLLFFYLQLYSYIMLDILDIYFISDFNENYILFYVIIIF